MSSSGSLAKSLINAVINEWHPGQAVVPNDDIITTPSPPSPSSAIPEYDVQA